MAPIPLLISTTLYIDEEELYQPILVKLALEPKNFVAALPSTPMPSSSSRFPSFSSKIVRETSPAPIQDTVNENNCLIGVEKITGLGMWMIDMINDRAPPRPDRGMHPLDWLRVFEEEAKKPVEILSWDPQLDGPMLSSNREKVGKELTCKSFSYPQRDIEEEQMGMGCRRSSGSSTMPVIEEEDAKSVKEFEKRNFPVCPIQFLLTDYDEDEHYWIDSDDADFQISYPTPEIFLT